MAEEKRKQDAHDEEIRKLNLELEQSNVGKKAKRGKQKFNLGAEHIDIIALGEGDAQSIMKRMKMIED